MKFSAEILLSTLVLPIGTLGGVAAPQTGVFGAFCEYKDDSKQHYDASKDCCAAIGGGPHYYEDIIAFCMSKGWIAYKQVWWEDYADCCASRNSSARHVAAWKGDTAPQYRGRVKDKYKAGA